MENRHLDGVLELGLGASFVAKGVLALLLAGSVLPFAACGSAGTEPAAEPAATEEATTEDTSEPEATDEATTEDAGESEATEEATTEPEATEEATTEDVSSVIDYMVLVNKENPLPEGWEEALDLVEEPSLLYDDPVRVERAAYEAYQGLKEDLANEGTYVELDSCYRSVAEQQEIVESFTEKYGEDYVKQYVAVPGYSEHHTGLALDLFLVIDGEQVYENEEMVKHPEVWEKVHAKLADHGFILRYLEGKDDITGYSYEPWHIRYIGDAAVAHEIMDNGLTFEEYLQK